MSTALEAPRVVRALGRLRAGGLVEEAAPGRFAARPEIFKEAARQAAPDSPASDEPDPVLRVFMPHGRLTSIPASRSKRLVILDRIAQAFEPGRRYEEQRVNELLREFHPDYATLRRYLVDEGLLDRRAGRYWRSGGTFEVE